MTKKKKYADISTNDLRGLRARDNIEVIVSFLYMCNIGIITLFSNRIYANTNIQERTHTLHILKHTYKL